MENNFLKSNSRQSQAPDPTSINSDVYTKINDKELENFNDLRGVTVGRLNVGLWYIENKHKLTRYILIVLFTVSVVAWGYVLYGLGYYFAFGIREDEKVNAGLTATLGVGHKFLEEAGAKELTFQSTRILSAGNDRYDFVLRVYNPNPNHYADFDYGFYVDSEKMDSAKGFILPQESKYLMFLSKEFKNRPNRASIQIDQLNWHRIDKHTIPDWGEFKKTRTNITVSNIKLNLSADNGRVASAPNQLDFDVANRTPFNFYQVDFVALLMRGDTVMSVNRYGLENFMSMASQHINLAWPGNLDPSGKVEIVPEVNVMSDDVYIGFNGKQPKADTNEEME